MKIKEFLQKQIADKEAKIKDYKARAKASTDINEVRSFSESIDSMNDEIAELRGQLTALELNEQRDNLDPLATYDKPGQKDEVRDAAADFFGSMEWRKSFAAYVQKGTAPSSDLMKRAAEFTVTGDVGMIIPTTILNEIIQDLDGVYGQLYARVRKLNIQGGVEIAIADLGATVKWITETTTSETQKAGDINQKISFSYHIVEGRISQTLLSNIVSLPILEREIARILVAAFVKEFDNVIVNGDGSGKPLGILKDTRVPASHKIALSAADSTDWASYRKKLFAKIPLAYQGRGLILMTLNTWESTILTLKDGNNRPLATEAYVVGDDTANVGGTVRRFMGREVMLVEPDILKDFETAATGEVFMIYFKPDDYIINTNLQIGFKRWFDDDNNKFVNKGLAILDGKLGDVNSVYLLTKGA